RSSSISIDIKFGRSSPAGSAGDRAHWRSGTTAARSTTRSTTTRAIAGCSTASPWAGTHRRGRRPVAQRPAIDLAGGRPWQRVHVLDQPRIFVLAEPRLDALLDLAREVRAAALRRSEEHTSELQSRFDLVCRLLLEKKKK